MRIARHPPLHPRRTRALPPAPPVPPTLQTLASRWRPLSYVERCHARYGRFTIYPIDMPPLVFLSDPEEIRAVVSAPADMLHPGAGSAILAPLIGEQAFLLAEEDEHFCARTETLPAFQPNVVHEHAAAVEEVAGNEIAAWPIGVAFPAHPRIRSLILRAVLNMIFASEERPTITTLHRPVLELLSITDTALLQQPRLRFLPGWRSTWQQFIKRRSHVERLIFAIIAHRGREPGNGRDVLATLLHANNADGAPMSDRQIHDHVMSIIVAGHETTAAELAWSLQLLAHNPCVQQRLVDELALDTDAPYLTATIHETMRHRPAFMFAIPREVAQPIEIGGWSYPKGTHLVPCTYLMHHNPALFPDPDTFRPERFLDRPAQAGSYLPWGAGRKRCIGRHFALLEMQSVLREIVNRYTIHPASENMEAPRWRSAILVPRAGSQVVLQRRPSDRTLFSRAGSS